MTFHAQSGYTPVVNLLHIWYNNVCKSKAMAAYARIGGTMRESIAQFCTEHQFPLEAQETLLNVYESILKTSAVREIFFRTREEYDQNPQIDYQDKLSSLQKACLEENISPESASLLLFIILVPRLTRYYEQASLPVEICRASMDDLKWKLLECRRVHGIWGSFVSWWFPGFFMLKRFTLGRLQFELTPFPEAYEKSGRVKPQGLEQAINMHIPSSGPLRHEDCLHSYRLAADFFRPAFPGKEIAFVCHSWLLYPENRSILPANSRILEFMNDFDIYETEPDPQGGDLWRIFGRPDCSDTASLPEETSLQRVYKQWLLAGGTPGAGRGLFLLQG